MNVFPSAKTLNFPAPEENVGEESRVSLQEARDIIARAEEIRQQAQEEGFRQGMNHARAEALDMLVNLVRGNIDSISSLEQSVVDVCLDAYRTFFGLLGHERMLAGLIHKAINHLPPQQSILVRTAPDELDSIQAGLNEMTLPTASTVSLVPDQAVAAGSCVVQTDTTTTHLNIDVQTELLFELIRKHFV